MTKSTRPKSRPAILALLVATTLAAGCVAVVPVPVNQRAAPVVVPGPAPASARCPLPDDARARRSEIVSMINSYRRSHGLSPVRSEKRMMRAAQAHACDNAARGLYSHTGSDGTDLRGRLLRQGFRPRIAVENTGLGFRKDTARMMDYWINSPQHRANLLNPKVKYMGLGVARPAGGRTAWVLNMGTPL
ncbi:MAG: CAP domain-containing protein [Paracoccaceae bacterium]